MSSNLGRILHQVLFCFLFWMLQSGKSFCALPVFKNYFAHSALGTVKTKESARFIVSWIHPRDEILADAALEHMEAAHKMLEPIFRLKSSLQKTPIEIFPDLKTFSEVSGLSMARFRATGTIALTLEQRIMILSPRNLVSGYSWAETLVHEYGHYLIREISEEHIPIWLHEGVAQLFQSYPYSKIPKLHPWQWGLFKKYRAQNKLLSLKTLQEPFPYRKDPEEAELAYIQALLFVEWLNNKCGAIQLIRWAEEFLGLDRALQKCTKQSLTELERDFLGKIMASISIPSGSDVKFYARDFSGRDPVELEGEKENREARNFAVLSSRLFNQGRFLAASYEMERAIAKIPASPPSWRRQLVLSHQKSKAFEKSIKVLDELLRDYPEDAAGWYLRATQLKKDKKYEKSWNALLHAFFVNPFLEGLAEDMHLMKEEFPKFSYSFKISDN